MLTNFEFEVYVHKDRLREAERWCKKELGERWSVTQNRQGKWCCFWAGHRGEHAGKYRFGFNEEETAMWFALRWA